MGITKLNKNIFTKILITLVEVVLVFTGLSALGFFFFVLYAQTYSELVSKSAASAFGFTFIFYIPIILLTSAVATGIYLALRTSFRRLPLLILGVLGYSLVAGIPTIKLYINYQNHQSLKSSNTDFYKCSRTPQSNWNYQYECLTETAKNIYGPDICSQTRSIGVRCTSIGAIIHKDTSLCMIDGLDECKNAVSVLNQDYNLCKDPRCKLCGGSICSDSIRAIQELDPNKCNDYQLCKLLIAQKTNNLDLCLNTLSTVKNRDNKKVCDWVINTPPDFL